MGDHMQPGKPTKIVDARQFKDGYRVRLPNGHVLHRDYQPLYQIDANHYLVLAPEESDG